MRIALIRLSSLDVRDDKAPETQCRIETHSRRTRRPVGAQYGTR
ncbi:hypothetical protein PQU63_06755 [Xanthomonas protegens]|uniref:Uncharacterized protein n=1 Tax=Xanthomonas protegens TaxID=3380705 RepID=A0ABU9LG00_9XANT